MRFQHGQRFTQASLKPNRLSSWEFLAARPPLVVRNCHTFKQSGSVLCIFNDKTGKPSEVLDNLNRSMYTLLLCIVPCLWIEYYLLLWKKQSLHASVALVPRCSSTVKVSSFLKNKLAVLEIIFWRDFNIVCCYFSIWLHPDVRPPNHQFIHQVTVENSHCMLFKYSSLSHKPSAFWSGNRSLDSFKQTKPTWASQDILVNDKSLEVYSGFLSYLAVAKIK